MISSGHPQADPCKNYKSIDDPYRSTKYKWQKNLYASKCDDKLTSGWYRFTSIVGGKMPTTKPDPYSCGTLAPIWIKDTHPTKVGEQKQVTACTNVRNMMQGCMTKDQISVKKCNGSTDFFVYKLKPTYGCPRAYCAGRFNIYFYKGHCKI